MTKTGRSLLWLVVILAISIPFGVWFYHELQIDKCLDAGGAWDYQQRYCVYEEHKR